MLILFLLIFYFFIFKLFPTVTSPTDRPTDGVVNDFDNLKLMIQEHYYNNSSYPITGDD